MEYNLADIKAAVGNDNGMFGGGNSAWLIFLFIIFIFGFGGNGFGNGRNDDYVRRTDLDQVATIQKLDGITNGLSSVAFENARGQEALSRQLCDCCCTTNRNIDSVKQEICEQTYVITKAIHDEGEATRGLITTNLLSEKDRQISTLQTQAIVNAQTTAILDAQGRYVTNPPCNPCYPCGACGTY